MQYIVLRTYIGFTPQPDVQIQLFIAMLASCNLAYERGRKHSVRESGLELEVKVKS